MRKLHIVLFLLVVLLSCKKNNDVLPNRPPSDFIVNSKLIDNGKSILLNWTKAKDLDGDIVKYSVVLTDTLIKQTLDTFFLIKEIGYNIEKQGQVIAIDSKGLKTSINFSAVTKKNSAPSNVIVTQNIDEDGKTINLTWTTAIDLEGDEVNYTIILGDTLASKIKDTKIVINSLDFNVEKSGVIITKDIHGFTSQTPFLVKTLEDPFFQIPDTNFERELIAKGFDNLQDGKMKKLDALKVRKLDAYAKGIVNLEGLHNFKNLTNFSYAGDARDIDLSSNKLIDTIFIAKSYQLESINLHGLNFLKRITVVSVKPLNFLDLDLMNKVNLTFIEIFLHSSEKIILPYLDFTKNLKIEYVSLNINSLVKIDFRGLVKLPVIRIWSDTPLKEICVSDIVQAEKMDWQYPKFTQIINCK